jgi:hypothetical protein
LPLIAPSPHIRQLALRLRLRLCLQLFCVSFSSAPASCCVVSHQPATLQQPPSIASPAHGWLLHLPPAPSSLIAVVWPLLKLRRCLPFCLSWASRPAGCCITSLSSGWLLRHLSSRRHLCLYSRRRLRSAGISASHCAVASHCAIASRAFCPAGCCVTSPHATASHLPATLPLISHPLNAIASRASSPAGCGVASPHAASSLLPASTPLIAPTPLVAPWPSVPLVPLVVVVSPLLTLPPSICQRLCLSLCSCLSSHYCLPCLLSGWLSRCLFSCRRLPSAGHSDRC